jgi:ribose/xylose/arabinose/galactoside ABC-type transport system permease subunit
VKIKVNLKSESKIKEFIIKNNRDLSLIVIIIAFIIIFSLLSSVFLSFQSFMNMARAIAPLALVSIGMTLAILSGGLDLSVGSSMALCGAGAALIINSSGNGYLGFLVAIVIGCSVGLINGFFIGKLKVNPIIVTLAMLGATRSLALVITNAETLRVENYLFNWLGNYNLKIFSSDIPVSIFLVIIFYICFYLFQKKSVFLRRISSIGGNPNSSKVIGIAVERNIVIVYVIIGFLVGIAGILSVGRVSSAAPFAGIGLEFEAITVVVLGGAALSGGEANIKNTLLGVLLFEFLIHGLKLDNVGVYYIDFTKGIIILLAVWINMISKRYHKLVVS